MACVLSDKLPNADFANADYIFHHERVVAELKCIQVDNIRTQSNQAKINAIVEKSYTQGQIATNELTDENWRRLPTELQNAIYDITTNAIRDRIKKANIQLRETRRRLGLEAYQGLLLICNDGVQSYPPAAFTHAAVRLVQRHFSEISCLVSFTANVYAVTHESKMPSLFWLSIDFGKSGKIDTRFLDRLGDAWRKSVGAKYQIPTHCTEMSDVEGFWNARNLPN